MAGSNSGGKRQGAGNPGKAMIPVVPKAASCSPIPSDANFTPAQRIAIDLFARGKKQYLIAQELGVDETTIFRWKQTPEFQSALDITIQQLADDRKLVFDRMIPSAIAKYEQALEQEDDLRLGVSVADKVFEGAFGKTPVAAQGSAIGSVTINIISHPDADAGKFIEKDIVVEGEYTEQGVTDG